MSIKKLISQLLEKDEKDEKIPELMSNQVISIIKNIFDGYEFKKGSHIIIRDRTLKNYWEATRDKDLGLNGELTIPVKGGKKVKREYVKDIIKAVKIKKDLEEKFEKE